MPLDTQGQDISRVCFFSYDPDLYINYDSRLWVEKIVKEKKVIEKKYIKNDYKTVQFALDFVSNSQEGQRHDRILKASRLMGGYIASEVISEEEGIRLLEQEAMNIDPDDYTGIKNDKILIYKILCFF